MKPTFVSLTAVFLGTVLLGPRAFGDTVVLKNGNKIDGTVITDERASGGKLVLGVAGGTMYFRASEVASIETTAAATAATGNYVEVKLAKGDVFYGTGSYFGIVSPQSTDEKLVLQIPNVGTVTIPRSAVASIEEIEGTSPDLVASGLVAPAAKPSEIGTTHAVYMKNGRKLIGNVLPTPAEEPLKVQIGHLGVLTVPRKDVDRVVEEAGTMTLPPEPERTEAEPAAAPEASPLPESFEALKEQIKAELLRELLQELLDVKVGMQLEEQAAPGQLVTTRMTIFGPEEVGMQELLGELSRNRTEFRTRAELRLKELGPAVLPYVNSLAHHPFVLTRRAVQRIARDLGVRESVPIAIEGLNDPDQFVREIAHETLTKLLPGAGVDYRPDAARQTREAAQVAYWGIWDEQQLHDARRKVLDRLAKTPDGEAPKKTSGAKARRSSPFGTDWRSAPPPATAGDWRPVPLLAPAAVRSAAPSGGDWRPVPLMTHGAR